MSKNSGNQSRRKDAMTFVVGFGVAAILLGSTAFFITTRQDDVQPAVTSTSVADNQKLDSKADEAEDVENPGVWIADGLRLESFGTEDAPTSQQIRMAKFIHLRALEHQAKAVGFQYFDSQSVDAYFGGDGEDSIHLHVNFFVGPPGTNESYSTFIAWGLSVNEDFVRKLFVISVEVHQIDDTHDDELSGYDRLLMSEIFNERMAKVRNSTRYNEVFPRIGRLRTTLACGTARIISLSTRNVEMQGDLTPPE